jgi:hypothetical protein
VIWTKKKIYLTSVSEYTVFDSIPLVEIASIQQINETSRNGSSTPAPTPTPQQHRPSSVKSADSSQTRFQYALQLKTIPDGFNSGRTYYLQAASDEQCYDVCESLSRLARRAREDDAATSCIRLAQERVAAVYESTPFQAAVALLIITVIGLSCTPLRLDQSKGCFSGIAFQTQALRTRTQGTLTSVIIPGTRARS